MAAKGQIAKENVVKKIAEVFGERFIGEFDKKIYVWSEENGEQVQVAIALTCPKTSVGAEKVMNFNEDTMSFTGVVTQVPETMEISEEEKDNIKKLMERLGL